MFALWCEENKSPSSPPTKSPVDDPTKPCYDYSDIVPIAPDKVCTGRSLFLEIRARYMETRDLPGSEKCKGGLSREIKAVTETTDTKAAHAMFKTWCEQNQSPSSPPTKSPVDDPTKPCYDYSDIVPIAPDKVCTGHSLFLEIRARYLETRDLPGSEKCKGGLAREIMAITGTTDTKAAHEMFRTWCESAAASSVLV